MRIVFIRLLLRYQVFWGRGIIAGDFREAEGLSTSVRLVSDSLTSPTQEANMVSPSYRYAVLFSSGGEYSWLYFSVFSHVMSLADALLSRFMQTFFPLLQSLWSDSHSPGHLQVMCLCFFYALHLFCAAVVCVLHSLTCRICIGSNCLTSCTTEIWALWPLLSCRPRGRRGGWTWWARTHRLFAKL